MLNLNKINVIIIGLSFFPFTPIAFSSPTTPVVPPMGLQLETRLQCPSDMVQVNDKVCIDKYEWPNKKGSYPLIGASGLPEVRDKKANQVWDAKTLCNSVGKRVCWDTEWISACKGKNNAKYPWGNDVPGYIPGEFDSHLACNFGKQYVSGRDEYKIYRRDKKEMARLDMREPSGSRQACKSAVGAYDMTGNVEEWVRCKNKTGWCLAGRYWAQLRECKRIVRGHAPRWHYYETGFRCCKDIK